MCNPNFYQDKLFSLNIELSQEELKTQLNAQ
jgi:hypothetical protein